MITIIVVLIFGGLTFIFKDNGRYQERLDSFHNKCAQEGGHIYSPDSIEWCLTNDSRIIEIYP